MGVAVTKCMFRVARRRDRNTGTLILHLSLIVMLIVHTVSKC